MKYVLMFVDTEQFAADLAGMDDTERERAYGRVQQWFADNHDKIMHHRQLMPGDSATTVRLDRGDPLITDGPFVEGKEVVSGFIEVEADNLDDVLKLVRSWPGCPVVEIRPVELTPLG